MCGKTVWLKREYVVMVSEHHKYINPIVHTLNNYIINVSQPLKVESQQINMKFIPYHERFNSYNEVRERILTGIDRKSHRNTVRMRQYFGERKA